MFALHDGCRTFGVAGVQPDIHAAVCAVRLRTGFKSGLCKECFAHGFKAPPLNRCKYRRAPLFAFWLVAGCSGIAGDSAKFNVRRCVWLATKTGARGIYRPSGSIAESGFCESAQFVFI